MADINIIETIGMALLWLVIGIGISMLLVKFYDFFIFRKFDLQEAIEKRNIAVSIFFGLMLLGIGLVVGATIISPGAGSLLYDIVLTIGWSIATSLVATLFFFGFDKLLVPKVELQEEISNNNIASGIFSGILYVAVSVVAMAVIMT
ncbi:MAG: hypothetical protein MASP_00696 [Candidatus Methanolliviera sp. GoM_asphalt]|nr:MAG: hypothetical protein MASP_00696 [Candidatus Methanolliviera sp. GoM_asphalt]